MKKIEDAYLQIIRKYHPAVKEKDIIIRDYGWDNKVFIVSNTIFRFPRNRRALMGLGPQIRFANQFCKKTSLSIPLAKKYKTFNTTFATYPLIEGDPLKPIWLKQCTKINQKKIAGQLGKFLSALHSFSIASAKKMGVREHKAGFVSHDSTNFFRTNLKPLLTKEEWNWVVKRLRRIRKLVLDSEFTPVVAHNDVAPQHLLFNRMKQRLVGVIDFGDLAISDPALDFFRLSVYPQSFLSQVKKLYGRYLDNNFADREKAYQDLALLHRLTHYTKEGKTNFTKIIRREFSLRMNQK